MKHIPVMIDMHSRRARPRRSTPPSLHSALLCCGLATASCDVAGDLPIDNLGYTGTETGTSPASPPQEAEPPYEEPGLLDPAFVGTWVGYVDNPLFAAPGESPQPYLFPSGSRQIRIDIDFAFDEENIDDIRPPTGRITFGAGELPALEAGVAYPGVDHYYASVQYPTLFPPVEGFAYSLKEGVYRFEDSSPGSLSLSYHPVEAFADWCALQPSLLYSAEGEDVRYRCTGSAGYAGGDPERGIPCINFLPDDSEEEIDCNLVSMCTGDVCECDADGCRGGSIYNNIEQRQALWLRRNGDGLVGAFVSTVFDVGERGRYLPMGTLHLERLEE